LASRIPMEKRYQVFVSSTYADLKEERRHVIQALLEMDCIPAGMELFPATDEEQFSYIKRIIDDCDYYLLIVGGRYGSTTPEGISYTEKEYDYAVEKGLKVIAFLREKILVRKSDTDPKLRARLTAFRAKLTSNRLVKFWTKADELKGLVALSLQRTIKDFPAVGWVRANAVANEEGNAFHNVLKDIANGKKEKEMALWGYGKHDVVGAVPLNDTWQQWIKGLVITTDRPDLDYYNFGKEYYFWDLEGGRKIEIPTGNDARHEIVGNFLRKGMVLRLMRNRKTG